MDKKSWYLYLQRGDGGIHYINLVLVLIIIASFFMAGGLSIELKDLSQSTVQGSSSTATDGGCARQFGDLPCVPEKSSQEFLQGRICAQKLRELYKKNPNAKSEFTKTGKPQIAPPECL